MSDALPVLVVPDADDTTRRVLSALRAAALAEAPPPADEERPQLLLRWDRPTALRLDPSATPVRGADGRVLFVEGTLTETDGSPSSTVEPDPEGPSPPGQPSTPGIVAALLAFAEAASRAATPTEACAAAVVVAEQVLGAERVAVMRRADDGHLVLGAASRTFEAPLHALLADPARWREAEVPSLTTALPEIETTSAPWVPDSLHPLLNHAHHRAALLLPIRHRDQPLGVIWAFYETPQAFDLDARQRGGLLAHHVAATLAERPPAPEQPASAEPALEVPVSAESAATPATAAQEPTESALPLKALVGLATVAAYGMERADDGTWAIAWATRSFRKLLDAEAERALTLGDVLAAVHPSDTQRVLAKIKDLDVGRPTRFDHRLVMPGGQTRWVRQAVVRRERGGNAEVLAVLLDIDPDRVALRRTEEALAEARHRASTSLLPSISESLRAPIATILERAQLLSQPGPIRDNERLQLAHAIAEHGRTLFGSLNLMVDLARIEAGEVDLVRSDLDFHEAVGRVFEVLIPLAARKGIKILARRGPVASRVHQDAHALSRVLHHVVSVAITQAPAGTLRVRTDQVEGKVRLSFQSEAVPKSGATPTPEGGLTSPLNSLIAERLIALMGGDLYQEATANASFYLRLDLPLVERAPFVARALPEDASTSATVALPHDESTEVLPSTVTLTSASSGATSADTMPQRDLPVPVSTKLDPVSNIGTETSTVWEASAEGVEDNEAPLQSMPHRQHASLEAAANALMLFDPLSEVPADTAAAEEASTVTTERSLDEGARAVAVAGEEKPYARTEIALPVGVTLPYPEPPPRKEAAPAARAADAPPALDTALDAFAGVEADPPEDAASPQPEDSGPARVLVVEDNPETRLLLERLIGREFEVVAVDSPRAALDALTRFPFDALVLDINLGGRETGLDILRIARSLDGYADTFAMAVTAYGDEVDTDRFLSAGFQAYVQKPFDPERILDPLRSALTRAVEAHESDA